ncbi:hypothetical protein CBS147321_9862 [Aspergillus niger]|nr:hypothetical protein CBS133816_9680 [Aspergillus niger]KAI2914820.1 hypothetical protein CBS147371_6040 [Aspergillus niger]KAI2932736.1 hypothetical protein CBS147321_9862 [Aspergillus niger]KAI2942899.1 hypothetical protein CBS147322_8647 [Aspergillus niger]KAI2996569.1 hypothetical protein CBS147346_9276 [Aspergillus niger]
MGGRHDVTLPFETKSTLVLPPAWLGTKCRVFSVWQGKSDRLIPYSWPSFPAIRTEHLIINSSIAPSCLSRDRVWFGWTKILIIAQILRA